MKPLVFVWPYAVLFWAVFLWAFWPEYAIVRRARGHVDSAADKSLQVILRGQSAAFVASFLLAWVPALHFVHRAAALYGGIASLAAGSLLRRHCWRMLGSSFTGDVQASADQAVVDRGAYRWLRHPSYTGGILMNTGVGLALGSWASAALMAVVSTGVYVYRISVEESALLGAIGEPYRRFLATRKRLIPFVW